MQPEKRDCRSQENGDAWSYRWRQRQSFPRDTYHPKGCGRSLTTEQRKEKKIAAMAGKPGGLKQ